MAENRRKSENIRRANRVIQTRTFVLMLVLGVAVFLVLALKLYQLQIKQHDYYQSKALDQQTRSTVVTASRGTIYDRNGNELAVSATAETVFLSPKELAEELEKPETTLVFMPKKIARTAAARTPIKYSGIGRTIHIRIAHTKTIRTPLPCASSPVNGTSASSAQSTVRTAATIRRFLCCFFTSYTPIPVLFQFHLAAKRNQAPAPAALSVSPTG